MKVNGPFDILLLPDWILNREGFTDKSQVGTSMKMYPVSVSKG